MKVQVRDYKPSDFEQVEYLWQQTDMGGSHRGDNAAVIERTLQMGAKMLVMETASNQLIGTAWITNDGRRLYLHHFGILPHFQGQGLGKQLLQPVFAFARKAGMQLKLEVHRHNKAAIALYKNAGFEYLGDYDVHIIRNWDKILV